MVKPIHLQDNFSKTLIAQRMADEAHTGAEKQQQVMNEAVQVSIEKQAREKAGGLEERKGLKSTDPDGKNRQSSLKKEKKRDDEEEGGDYEDEGYVSDLRRRREEDDRDKGGKLDMKG